MTNLFKARPRWLKIGLVLLGLMLVAALVLPYFLDADRYRPAIASAIEDATGRKVTIGKIRARLLPTPGFSVDGFWLANPPGFPDGDLLAVETLRGSLTWGAIFGGERKLTSVELVKPRLVLLEDDRGRTNYSFDIPPTTAKGKAAPASDDSSLFQLSAIENVELSDAEIVLGRVARGRAPVTTLRAQNLDATLRDVALSPLRLKQWKSEVPLNGVKLELAGWKEPFEFRSGELQLDRGKLSAEFRGRMGRAAELEGNLNLADVERGVPVFELRASQLDVGQLLAAQSDSPPGAAPIARKSELVAQGRLKADRIRWQSYQGNNATAEVRIFSDRVELWPVLLQAYGGTIQVSARTDRSQSPERFSANIQIRSLDLAGLAATDLSTRGKISGTGELDLQLVGSLSPVWMQALSGSGNFTIRDGRLPGINLGDAMQSVAGVLGVGKAFGGDTPFRSIAGDLNIAAKRVASRQIHMDSPQGTVDLQGSFGLDSTLDYNGEVTLVPGAAGSAQTPADAITGILGAVLKKNVTRASVPISISGTFSDPKVRPGRGRPRFETSAPQQTGSTQQQQQPKKPSIFDLFKKP